MMEDKKDIPLDAKVVWNPEQADSEQAEYVRTLMRPDSYGNGPFSVAGISGNLVKLRGPNGHGAGWVDMKYLKII